MFTHPISLLVPSKKQGVPMIWTVDTSLGDGLNQMQIPTREGYLYSVDYIADEGTANEKTGSYNSWDDPDTLITFNGSAGSHTIKMTGVQQAIYFNNGGDKLKLTSIDQWGDPTLIVFDSSFYGCENLINISNDWPYDAIMTGAASMFASTGLTSLPATMLLIAIVTADAMFMDTPLASLPSGITMPLLVSGASMFRNTNLTSLPSGITLVNLSNGNAMFRDSLITSISSSMTLSSLTDGFRMFLNVTINTTDYSQLLINTANAAPSIQSNVPFDAGNSLYNISASEARRVLEETYNWDITDRQGLTYQNFVATADITDTTQKNAVFDLVQNLAESNVLSKIYTLYPFVGGDAAKHSYNLIDPSNFQMTWSGTLTHSSTGVEGSANGKGLNGWIMDDEIAATDGFGLFFYARETIEGTVQKQLCTQYDAAGTHGLLPGAGEVGVYLGATGAYGNTGTLNAGLHMGSSLPASRLGIWYNDTVITDESAPSAENHEASLEIPLFCRNYYGAYGKFASTECACFGFIDHLSGTEGQNLYAAIQQFQTDLSREV